MAAIRLTQIDGKLPNLALMKLARYHRDCGDDVRFFRSPYRQLGEPEYDRVYGSAIFSYSAKHTAALAEQFPGAIIGGTGTATLRTVEDEIGEHPGVDYSFYPKFDASLGFTQRGCRLSCKFCVVPKKEGKPRAAATIADIWRGEDKPRTLVLLDNDFFGQPAEEWRARIAEIIAGKFKVSFIQGVNVRAITDETAAALASVHYCDDSFQRRRLYTAWDNLKDEEVFFTGVDTLERSGVPPTHIMAYMLIGFDKNETWARIFHRFNRMVERGIKPYPMAYGNRLRTVSLGGYNDRRVERKTLADFQRWVIPGIYRAGIPFGEYNSSARASWKRDGVPDLFDMKEEA